MLHGSYTYEYAVGDLVCSAYNKRNMAIVIELVTEYDGLNAILRPRVKWISNNQVTTPDFDHIVKLEYIND
jgi:hypothetical protein